MKKGDVVAVVRRRSLIVLSSIEKQKTLKPSKENSRRVHRPLGMRVQDLVPDRAHRFFFFKGGERQLTEGENRRSDLSRLKICGKKKLEEKISKKKLNASTPTLLAPLRASRPRPPSRPPGPRTPRSRACRAWPRPEPLPAPKGSPRGERGPTERKRKSSLLERQTEACRAGAARRATAPR